MCSPVVSASDPGNKCTLKSIGIYNGKPCQYFDMIIQTERDVQLFLELHDVRLCMLGMHQLQNAMTSTCTALCLRDQGWRISDQSIYAGLAHTYMLGRGQVLSSKEAETLGFAGSTILLDGAHTKDSAKALVDTIQMTIPEARIALVVAMASDKDHLAFAKEILSRRRFEAVFLTEVDIGGGKSRTAPALSLKETWIEASKELGIDVIDDRAPEYGRESEHKTTLAAEESIMASMRAGSQILNAQCSDHPSMLVVTGSLHAVSSVLSSLHG